MSKYFLAVDIGASSGRHIIAEIVDGKIVLQEMYRFWNGMDEVDDILPENMTEDDRIVADMMIRNGNSMDITV